MSAHSTAATTDWQAPFLAMLPAIERQARQFLRRSRVRDREEAFQAIIAYAAVACARLAERNRIDLAYPTPLARYGLKQYRAGRSVGGSVNIRDVASARGQRQRRSFVKPLEDWQESLVDSRLATPAELAGFRLDFSAWLRTLTPRDRRVAKELGRGEPTCAVASMFRLTAGRVSQLRRELEASWLRSVGDPVCAAC